MLGITKQFLGMSSLILAFPCFSGIYVGAGVGPEGASFRQKAHVVRPGSFDAIDKNRFSGTGGFGTLFAGYGWSYKRFYLGGEINANLSSVEHKLTNDEYLHGTSSKTTFTVRNSEGLSLLPGFFFSDNTWFYGRIGYANGHVKIRESDPTIRSASKNRGGIRYGLGLRHGITERWTVMMDYSQINYGSITSSVFEPMGGVLKNTKISPNTAQVAFGVIYNFDVPQKIYVK